MTHYPLPDYFRARLDFLRTALSDYTGAFIVGVVCVHAAAAFFNGGFLNADEHYQIIEFAQYKMGRQSLSGLAWEYAVRMRPALQPWLAFVVIRFCRAFDIASPFATALGLRLLSTVIALWTSLEVCVRCLRSIEARWLRVTALGASFLLWITPTVHGRFSSENWGGALLVGGLCLMLDAADAWPARRAKVAALGACAGLVWSAAFYCRFQLGFAIAGAGIWMVLVRRGPVGLVVALAAAFFVRGGLN